MCSWRYHWYANKARNPKGPNAIPKSERRRMRENDAVKLDGSGDWSVSNCVKPDGWTLTCGWKIKQKSNGRRTNPSLPLIVNIPNLFAPPVASRCHVVYVANYIVHH